MIQPGAIHKFLLEVHSDGWQRKQLQPLSRSYTQLQWSRGERCRGSMVCPLGGAATSKAPQTRLSWVPKELSKVHRRSQNSSDAAAAHCRPPGRKRRQWPHLHLCSWSTFNVFKLFPSRAEGDVKGVQGLRVKTTFDMCFWTSGGFEIILSPQEWAMWTPKQGW